MCPPIQIPPPLFSNTNNGVPHIDQNQHMPSQVQTHHQQMTNNTNLNEQPIFYKRVTKNGYNTINTNTTGILQNERETSQEEESNTSPSASAPITSMDIPCRIETIRSRIWTTCRRRRTLHRRIGTQQTLNTQEQFFPCGSATNYR